MNERITISGDEEQHLSPAEVYAILQDRATKLAQVYTQNVEATTELVHLITFSRGPHRYGIELRHLTEIRPLADWTPVPGIPPHYLGVIHLRGEIIALMDLATLFGGLESGTSADAFAVVVFWRDVVAALLADSVDDVHDLRPEQIHPPLTSFSQARERYISGLTDSGLAIVDVEKLLSDEWLWVKQETQEETR